MGTSLIAKSVYAGLASDTEVNWYGRGYVHAIKLFFAKMGQLTQFAPWE